MANAAASLLLTVNDATRAGFAAAEAGARRFGSRIQGALGGLGFGGFTLSLAALGAALGKVTLDGIEFGDQIAKAAARAGVGVEAFSKLAFAAEQSDIELNTLSKALKEMQLGLSKTSERGGEFADELRDLGISLRELDGLSTDQQFLRIADAVGRVDDAQQRTRLGTEIFGKAFQELAPAIDGGADALREMTEQARIFRLELSEEQVKALTDADDALKKLSLTMKGLGVQFAAFAAGGVTAFSEFTREILGTLTPLEEIEKKIRLLKDAEGSIPVFFNFGYIDGEDVVMGPESIKRVMAELEAQKKKLLEAGNKSPEPAINDEIDVPELGNLRLGLDAELGQDVKKQVQEALLTIEGETERNRILGLQLTEEQQQSIIENEQAYFAELQRNVLQNAEEQAAISEEVLTGYFDRIGEKVMEKSDFLEGAAEEFGRSVQSSLSDVFFNAGKGADQFADSVLNAFKRIIADAAAQKVVSLLGSLFGGTTGSGAGAGSSSGFGSAIATGLGALFGGARAEGGPVSSGRGYLVGERGPELFLPRQSGAIVPNSAMGGGTVNVVNNVNIDARGATQDGVQTLMSRLPQILEQNRKQTKTEIREEINRRQFGLK